MTTTTVASTVNPSVTGQGRHLHGDRDGDGTGRGHARRARSTFKDGGVNISGQCGRSPSTAAPQASCTPATYLAIGSHTITAVYAGDGNYNGSTLGGAHPDGQPGGTTTTVASSVNPSVTGQAVTYTATVTVTIAPARDAVRPSDTVTFKDGGVND